ncbi:MAG: SpoIIE family protein phosphatase [Acidobacteria bacterium]|nr:SpoIIE family protein phosphatase [Acidobacteriota bacterium]
MTAIRDWLTGTFAGRALLLGTSIKGVTLSLAAAGVPLTGVLGALDTLGGVSLVAGAAVLGYRLFVVAKRRLLWRVRRKLTLSYIFIGFVPALLIIGFFLLSGLLLFFNIGSYLMRSRLQTLLDQVQFMAENATLELEQAGSQEDMREALERRQAGAAARFPNTSYAVVRADRTCEDQSAARETSSAPQPLTAGPWAHVDAPSSLPAWVPCGGRAGLLAYYPGSEDRVLLAIRAIALPDARVSRYAVVVDLPVGEAIVRGLRADTGIQVGAMTEIEGANAPYPVDGRAVTGDSPSAELRYGIRAGPANIVPGDEAGASELRWVTLLDYLDWDTGRAGTVAVTFQLSPLDVYRRISATSLARINNLDFGQIVLILLAVVAGLFLVIQIVALGMGLGLARSITGSVHELFTGTERVRQGDFTHKIPIRTRDQLGELADSFNSMTASIEELLQQKAEKERLEQELRIARDIQMSLLPQGPLRMPGLELTAHCEPAREVGGDYYDVLPIDEHRLGILIADVAGKGTSAALYMAELKGLIFALSELHRSPRQLLIDANRIISRHLDKRSFITITYAVADLEAGTLTHARAGHCPLLYLPGPARRERRVQVLMPDGLVLGLQIDNGEMFNSLLEEVTVPIGRGDLFVLYTDGITEAMNASGDYFGDSRLGALIEEHGDLPFDELRERILREIRSFVGTAPQHDDMTMLLLRVEGRGGPEDPPLRDLEQVGAGLQRQ